ncbi:MAG: peptidyl-prolyl cis-trans isomerase [Deltaproteobacteria bacterium]|nr:peptidyl-prolyl cis-trans isomerase [Deltaproteobacteria bacterium]
MAALALGCVGGSGGPQRGSAVPGLPPPGVEIGPPVAHVGDMGVVGANELFGAAAREMRDKGLGPLSAEHRRIVLARLAEDEALFQEAARQGLHRDPKVRKTMINLLMRQEVYSKVKAADFTDEEMKAYFDAHRAEFVVPEKVHIKRIFIAVDHRRPQAQALALANEVRAKVMANPGKFKDLAAAHSEDTWKRRGGDLSYVSREGPNNGIDPAVVEAAFALPVGGVSTPFLAGGGYNVVLNAAHRDRVERGYSQMEGSILRQMKAERTKVLLEAYVAKVRAAYPVTVDDAVLDGVDLAGAARVPLDTPVEEEEEEGDESHEEVVP